MIAVRTSRSFVIEPGGVSDANLGTATSVVHTAADLNASAPAEVD